VIEIAEASANHLNQYRLRVSGIWLDTDMNIQCDEVGDDKVGYKSLSEAIQPDGPWISLQTVGQKLGFVTLSDYIDSSKSHSSGGRTPPAISYSEFTGKSGEETFEEDAYWREARLLEAAIAKETQSRPQPVAAKSVARTPAKTMKKSSTPNKSPVEPLLVSNSNTSKVDRRIPSEHEKTVPGTLEDSAAEPKIPESLEERIQREQQERYEQSEEYKQLQASKKPDAQNIALAVGPAPDPLEELAAELTASPTHASEASEASENPMLRGLSPAPRRLTDFEDEGYGVASVRSEASAKDETIAALTAQLAEAKGSAEKAAEKADELQEQNDDLQMTVLSRVRQVHALEHEVKVLGDQVEQMEEAAAESEDAAKMAAPAAPAVSIEDVEKLNVELETAQAAAATAEEKAEELQENNDNLEMTVLSRVREVHALEHEVKVLGEQMEKAEEAAAASEEASAATSAVSSEGFAELNAEHETAQAAAEELQEKNDDLEMTVLSRVREVHALEHEVKVLGEQMEKAEEAAAASEEASAATSTVSSEGFAELKAELETAKATAEELQEKNDDFEMTVLSRVREVHALKHEVKVLGEQMEKAEEAAAAASEAASAETSVDSAAAAAQPAAAWQRSETISDGVEDRAELNSIASLRASYNLEQEIADVRDVRSSQRAQTIENAQEDQSELQAIVGLRGTTDLVAQVRKVRAETKQKEPVPSRQPEPVKQTASKTELDATLQRVEELQEKNDDLEMTVLSRVREVHALEHEVKVLGDQMDQAAAASEADSGEVVQKTDSLVVSVPVEQTASKAELDAALERVEELQEKNDDLEMTVLSRVREVHALEHEVKVLGEQMEQAEQAAGASEAGSGEVVQEIASAAEEISALKAQLEKAEAAAEKVDELQEKNDDLEMTVLSRVREVHALKHEVKVLGEQMEQAEQAAEASEAGSGEVVQETASAAEEISALKAQLEKAEAAAEKVDELQEKNDELEMTVLSRVREVHALKHEVKVLGDQMDEAAVASEAATEAADASTAAGAEVVALKADLAEAKTQLLDATTKTKTTLQQVDGLRGKNDELEMAALSSVQQVHSFEHTVKTLQEQLEASDIAGGQTEERLAIIAQNASAAAADATKLEDLQRSYLAEISDSEIALRNQTVAKRDEIQQLSEELAAAQALMTAGEDVVSGLRLELAASMSKVSKHQAKAEENRSLLELEKGHAMELRGHLDRSHSSVIKMEAASSGRADDLAKGMQDMVAKLQDATSELAQATIERDIQAQRASDTVAMLDEANTSNIVLASKIEEVDTERGLSQREVMQLKGEAALLRQRHEHVMLDLEKATRQVGLLQATIDSQGDDHKELGTSTEQLKIRLQVEPGRAFSVSFAVFNPLAAGAGPAGGRAADSRAAQQPGHGAGGREKERPGGQGAAGSGDP
jgi:chromosome segregation ATPase